MTKGRAANKFRKSQNRKFVNLEVVTNEKGEALGEVLTIIF